MKIAQDTVARLAVRPSVCLCMAWGGAVYAWFVYTVHTTKYSVENTVAGLRFMDRGELFLGTGVNLFLILILLLDLRLALRSPRSMRTGYLFGIALALFAIGALEFFFLTGSRFSAVG